MADNPLSKSKLRRTVWDKTAGKCWYCGQQTNPWGDFCIDHIIPISAGGSDEPTNLVPCCYACNSRKRNRTLEDFRLFTAKAAGAIFSDEQLSYLESHNITLPAPDRHVFYFEQMGLAP